MEKIKKRDCVIVGAGTYGEVYASYLSSSYNIIGFIDDNEAIWQERVLDIKVLGNLDYLCKNVSRDIAVFVPIGKNSIRVKVLEKLAEEGFDTPSFIHPEAFIHDTVEMGKAIYILPGSRVMPLSVLGDFTMISLGVNVAHHVILEKGCFLSQGSNIGASIHLKSQAYVGIGAIAMTGVTCLGENCLIGAGSVVIKNVEDHTVVVGNPAKFLKNNL